MWLILQNVIAFFTVRVSYAYVIFSHNVRTVRVRYSGRERTVAPLVRMTCKARFCYAGTLMSVRLDSKIQCLLTLTVSAVRQGAMFPGLSAMWGQWAPPMERTRLAMISYTGGWS